jgi:hypothetical protein
MASQRINAATATGREQTQVKGINADFRIWQAGMALWATNRSPFSSPPRLVHPLTADQSVAHGVEPKPDGMRLASRVKTSQVSGDLCSFLQTTSSRSLLLIGAATVRERFRARTEDNHRVTARPPGIGSSGSLAEERVIGGSAPAHSPPLSVPSFTNVQASDQPSRSLIHS